MGRVALAIGAEEGATVDIAETDGIEAETPLV